MAHFCAKGNRDLHLDTVYVPASPGYATAYIWGGDGSRQPLELLPVDADENKDENKIAPNESTLPADLIVSYTLVAKDIGCFIGVVAGTTQRYTDTTIRVLPSAANRLDFMGKGKLFICGDNLTLCQHAEVLLSGWAWCSIIGRAVLREIFDSDRQAFFQIGHFSEDSITTSLSTSDGTIPGTGTFGTGRGSDALSRFNERMTLEESSCVALGAHGCAAIGWARPEFALMHELTHADRYMRGRATIERGDSRFGKLDEELVCLINNMYLSEKGGPLRANYHTNATMSYDVSQYFRDFHATARRLLILIKNDHPRVFEVTNTSTGAIPFNPVYAWFKGSSAIPDTDPGSEPPLSPDAGP
jgi:hypothetical protein